MEDYIGKICPYCKTEIQEGDAVIVCPACGIAHHEACWTENGGCTTFGCSGQHAAVQGTNPTDVCPTCGAVLAEEQAFCTNCGTPKQAPKANVCPTCGAALAEGQAFCPSCGTPMQAPKANVCQSCGAALAEGQAFCPKCGQRVGLTVDAAVTAKIGQINTETKKKSEKKVLVPILVGTAVLLLIIVLVAAMGGTSVESIRLSRSALELKEGDSLSLSYTIVPEDAKDVEVTWKSSNRAVATVSSEGRVTAVSAGSCTITVAAGDKSDSATVTVTSGPDFIALYRQYCSSTWADYGSDGSYLYIDTNPYDWDDDGLAYPEAYAAIQNVNSALGLPNSLIQDMGQTTGADGKQSETYGDVTVTWKYHPDKGLEVTYKLSN